MKTTAANLPRLRNRLDWKSFFANAQTADSLHTQCAPRKEPDTFRGKAGKGCRECGLHYSTTMQGSTFVLHVGSEKPAKPSHNADIATAEARHNNIPARIRQADINAAYWLRQIDLRTNPEGKALARGIHAGWKMTAACLRKELNTRALA